ncbi:hypothetical protein [Methylophaga lonarensis]|uniref:hypothetical protein n=1 Tax=Methylophaga lonarensis TaxID=999151 RepID=UPI003D2CCB29
MMQSRKQVDVQAEIDRLNLAGQRSTEPRQSVDRSAVLGNVNTGRTTPGTGGGSSGADIEYVPTQVTSTDGIFVFEILVDSNLL